MKNIITLITLLFACASVAEDSAIDYKKVVEGISVKLSADSESIRNDEALVLNLEITKGFPLIHTATTVHGKEGSQPAFELVVHYPNDKELVYPIDLGLKKSNVYSHPVIVSKDSPKRFLGFVILNKEKAKIYFTPPLPKGFQGEIYINYMPFRTDGHGRPSTQPDLKKAIVDLKKENLIPINSNKVTFEIMK